MEFTDPNVIKDDNDKCNPWQVPTLEEFLYYFCPECEVKTKEKSQFFNHAIETHDQAKISLENLENHSKIEIKEEPLDKNDFTFNCDICDFLSHVDIEIIEHLRSHQKKKLRGTKRLATYFTEEDERCPYW